MKKILTLLVIIMIALSIVACGGSDSSSSSSSGGSSSSSSSKNTASAETVETEVEADAITTVGPAGATELEMWTFVELHSQFYAEMLERWNAENPDKQLRITFTTYPYGDMHSKMIMATQTGTGAPDLVDIEIGQFPNFTQGQVPFRVLNDVIEPYQDDIVPARLEVYSKDDNFYGVPTHVGATVMFYNTQVLEEYGIDYTTIITWDDFTEAARVVAEKSNGETLMTSVDTGGSDWLWVAMASKGEDYTTEDGMPNIEIPSIKQILTLQQSWLDEGIAMISPGGQIDTEEGYAALGDKRVVAFPKAMWFMSRFLNYLPEMEDTWAIAPCPVFEEGDARSVGIGGTGTVVSNQSKHADLAAEFIAYAKLSYEGNVGIWDILGFDTVNTSIWTDETITTNQDNKYIDYFKNNPFDTLNEIKDEIGKIKVTTISPAIHEIFNITILNNVFEDGADIEEELSYGQSDLELEVY